MSRDNQGESVEVKVGKLEARMDGVEDKTKTNWKNLNSKIEDLNVNMKDMNAKIEKQSEDTADIKNSLAALTGATQTMQEQLTTSIACLEKMGVLESENENIKADLKQVKKDIEGLRHENIEIRKTRITAWTSIAVAVITGILSIIALVIKK